MSAEHEALSAEHAAWVEQRLRTAAAEGEPLSLEIVAATEECVSVRATSIAEELRAAGKVV